MSESMIVGFCFLWSLVVITATSFCIGDVHRHNWFQKRTKYSFFLRRGILGEKLHFGYPVCWQGYICTACMCACIAIGSYMIVYINS